MTSESHSNRRSQHNPALRRILMLVPYDPDLDSRVKRVIDLCAKFSHTDIISYSSIVGKPLREYNGITYLERIYSSEDASSIAYTSPMTVTTPENLYGTIRRHIRNILIKFGWLDYYRKAVVWLRDINHPWKLVIQILNLLRFPFRHFLNFWTLNRLTSDILYRRARAASIPPSLIICHDIFALAAAVKLKKIFKAPIIYDSHEFWPEADLQATTLEKKFMASFERSLIRQADAVITVSPQIAHTIERSYHLSKVTCVPNAMPFDRNISPSSGRHLSFPIKFLFQGSIIPEHGINDLLEAWRQLEDKRAILIIRAPENKYYAAVRNKFKKNVDDGHILFAPAVSEKELVATASSVDVGVIPYGGPNVNYVYGCPNELTQYMHAGLAILSNADMKFVSDIIVAGQFGQTYDATNPQSLIENVHFWLDHPEQLIQMKKKAFTYARTEFNWETQSLPYLKIIQGFIS